MTAPRPGDLSDRELERLDQLVEEALSSGDEDRLPVLGFGEISLVLVWPPEDSRFACKRLPLFNSMERFDAYRRCLEEYLAALAAARVRVIATEMRAVAGGDGSVTGYLVQPLIPQGRIAPAVLRNADPAAGHPLVEAVVATAAAVIGPRIGLDSQLSNWAWDGAELTYLDVSTPLIWSSEGRAMLDLELLSEAYPAFLRWPLRRFIGPGILDTYRTLRKAYLDLAGNLLKEHLDAWLPHFLERINRRIDDPLSETEVRRYYRSDARLWAALLLLRKADRAWRTRVRRRPYPFLLPGEIER